jgi:hypothetical protein
MRYHVEAVGTYGYLLRGERFGERVAHVRGRKRWLRIPFILFYDRTTQNTHTLHHHTYHAWTFVLFLCYQLRFLLSFLFSSFLGQLVAFGGHPDIRTRNRFIRFFTVLEYSMLHVHPYARIPL